MASKIIATVVVRLTAPAACTAPAQYAAGAASASGTKTAAGAYHAGTMSWPDMAITSQLYA
jgi:hypothetical protein